LSADMLLSDAAEDVDEESAALFDAFEELEHAEMLMAARIATSDVVTIWRMGPPREESSGRLSFYFAPLPASHDSNAKL
jgi:hypothetical protein